MAEESMRHEFHNECDYHVAPGELNYAVRGGHKKGGQVSSCKACSIECNMDPECLLSCDSSGMRETSGHHVVDGELKEGDGIQQYPDPLTSNDVLRNSNVYTPNITSIGCPIGKDEMHTSSMPCRPLCEDTDSDGHPNEESCDRLDMILKAAASAPSDGCEAYMSEEGGFSCDLDCGNYTKDECTLLVKDNGTIIMDRSKYCNFKPHYQCALRTVEPKETRVYESGTQPSALTMEELGIAMKNGEPELNNLGEVEVTDKDSLFGVVGNGDCVLYKDTREGAENPWLLVNVDERGHRILTMTWDECNGVAGARTCGGGNPNNFTLDGALHHSDPSVRTLSGIWDKGTDPDAWDGCEPGDMNATDSNGNLCYRIEERDTVADGACVWNTVQSAMAIHSCANFEAKGCKEGSTAFDALNGTPCMTQKIVRENGESKTIEVEGTYQFKEVEGVQTFQCYERPAAVNLMDCGGEPFC